MASNEQLSYINAQHFISIFNNPVWELIDE